MPNDKAAHDWSGEKRVNGDPYQCCAVCKLAWTPANDGTLCIASPERRDGNGDDAVSFDEMNETVAMNNALITALQTMYTNNESLRVRLAKKALVELWSAALAHASHTWRVIRSADDLPDADGRYLVTTKSGDVFTLHFEPGFQRVMNLKRWNSPDGEVVAWMPLPQPLRQPEGEGEGE